MFNIMKMGVSSNDMNVISKASNTNTFYNAFQVLKELLMKKT